MILSKTTKILAAGTIALSALVLGACQPQQVVVKKEPVKQYIRLAKRPEGVKFRNVRSWVVTPRTYKRFMSQYKKLRPDGKFFALDPRSYNNVKLNVSDLRRHMRQSLAVIVYYERNIGRINQGH